MTPENSKLSLLGTNATFTALTELGMIALS
jgi:hypothetical protein